MFSRPAASVLLLQSLTVGSVRGSDTLNGPVDRQLLHVLAAGALIAMSTAASPQSVPTVGRIILPMRQGSPPITQHPTHHATHIRRPIQKRGSNWTDYSDSDHKVPSSRTHSCPTTGNILRNHNTFQHSIFPRRADLTGNPSRLRSVTSGICRFMGTQTIVRTARTI